jgi:hypothetical protein
MAAVANYPQVFPRSPFIISAGSSTYAATTAVLRLFSVRTGFGGKGGEDLLTFRLRFSRTSATNSPTASKRVFPLLAVEVYQSLSIPFFFLWLVLSVKVNISHQLKRPTAAAAAAQKLFPVVPLLLRSLMSALPRCHRPDLILFNALFISDIKIMFSVRKIRIISSKFHSHTIKTD